MKYYINNKHMKKMASIFNESNFYISKKTEDTEPDDDPEETSEKWIAIEQSLL